MSVHDQNVDDVTATPPEGSPDPTPSPDPQPSAPSAEELERIRREQEAQAEQIRQAQQLMQTMAQLYATKGTAPSTPDTPADDDDSDIDDLEDLDPKEMMRRIRKEIRKTMETYSSGILNQIQQYAQQNEQRWFSTEKERVSAQLKELGMQDVLTEAERYLKENNVRPEVAAAPGVFEKAVQLVIGERVLKERMNQAQRGPRLSATSGAGTPEEPASQSFKEELEFLKSKGIEVDEKEWKELRTVESPILDLLQQRTR